MVTQVGHNRKITKRIVDAAIYEGDSAKNERCIVWDGEILGFGLRVYPGGRKSFVLSYRHNGRKRLMTIGAYPKITVEQARSEAKKLGVDLIKGADPLENRQRQLLGDTVKSLCAVYLKRHAAIKKSGGADERRINQHILPVWGSLKASAIKRADVAALHSKIGRDSGPYEANRALALISVMFKLAEQWGILEEGSPNPARGVKKFAEISRDRFLQPDELPKFFEALAQEPNDTIRDYILISLLTGARRSNVLGMRWAEINLERREWRIPTTKNGMPQTVPLSLEVVEILQARYDSGSDFVFPSNSASGHLVEPKSCWQRILQRAGLENLRIHDLRRSLGSWQLRTGASLTLIGKSLGHKSVAATAVYARLDIDPIRESVEKAGNAILAAAGVKEPGAVVPLRKQK